MDLALAALDRGVLALDDERRVVFLNRRAERNADETVTTALKIPNAVTVNGDVGSAVAVVICRN